MTTTPTIHTAMQRYRTAGLALMWHYYDREPQRLSHKTRLRLALAEIADAVDELHVALREWVD